MRQGSVTFSGNSGESYHFQVWSLDAKFRPVPAVYFITKRAYDNKTFRRACHDSIYIGQSDDLAGALVASSTLERFRRFGANCVCVYQHADDVRRSFVVQDLLDVYPTHCNYPERAANIFSYLK